LSFSHETIEGRSLDYGGDEDENGEEGPFIVPDYIVVDNEAKVILLKAS